MNMISTGAFEETTAVNKQKTTAEKFVSVWEKKNAKAAKAGGVSLMALSLAACGGSSDTATTPVTPAEPTTPTEPVAPVVPAVNTITKNLLDFKSGDTLEGTAGDDVANIEINTDLANTTTISGVETLNITSFGATSVDFKAITGVTTFGSANSTGAITVNTISDASMGFSFTGSGTNSITANYKAGALSGTADNLSISVNNATGVVMDVDAGFETVSINTGAAGAAGSQAASTNASTVTTLTAPGVTSVTLSGAGDLTMSDGTLTNVTTVTANGSGALKLGTFTGIKTIAGADATGAITVAATTAATGLAADSITGVAAGSTIQTGSGADHIDFVDGATAAKANTITTGAGDDVVELTINSGYHSVLMGAGDDTIHTGSTDSNDYIDGGAGNDTANLTGSNSATLRGIENVSIAATGSLDATNATEALAVTAKTDSDGSTATAVSVTNLASGSTVNIVDSKATQTTGSDSIIVGYKTAEAAATIDVDTAVTAAHADGITVTKVKALTIDFAKAVTLDATNDFSADDSTSLVITAAKATDLGEIAAATTDALTSITATSAASMDTGDINNDAALTTVTVTGTAGTVGTISTATKLTDVTVTGTTGAAALGAVGGGTAATAINDITVSGGTTATVGAIAAKSLTTNTVTATKGTLTHSGITVANSNAGVLGDVTLLATDGNIAVEAIDSDKTMGTISITSKTGYIDGELGGTDAAISAADTTGITVALEAKTFISGDGTAANATNDFKIENTKGNIDLSVAGAAYAALEVDAGSESDTTDGVVNLTATNTGGMLATIVQGAVTKDGASSTITLGNAVSGKSNDIALDGIADTTTINGGTGADNISFVSTNTFLNMTLALGDGTDKVDFSNYAATGANSTAYNGLAINLSSATVTFDAGTATSTALGAGLAKGYDNDAASTLSNIDSKGSVFTLSGVDSVVGTGQVDYIVAANTGTTINSGAGADTVILGAGADTLDFDVNTSTDAVTKFTTGTDKIDVDGLVGNVTGTALVAFNGGQLTSLNDGAIVIITGSAASDAATIAAKFETDDDNESADGGNAGKMEIDDNDADIIVIVEDDNDSSGNDYDAQIFEVSSNSDGSSITAKLVATIGEDGDSAHIAFADFV